MIAAAGWRGRWRRLWFGLLTLLGGRPHGFFIPYRYAASLVPAGARASYAPAEQRLAAAEPAFRQVLGWIEEAKEALDALGGPPPAPRFEQTWFPRLDAAAAYVLLQRLAPKRVVEIGSGHSTRFLVRARDDAGLNCWISAIDPAPRADLGRLDLDLHRKVLGEVLASAEAPSRRPAPFDQLEAGDFLMIDSSHILVPGSDVDDLLGRVLPALPAGVLVQFHDIFLPDDYPADWAWRGYNEQQGVLALLSSGGWEPVFSSHYAASRMSAELGAAASLPLLPGARESALWLRKGP